MVTKVEKKVHTCAYCGHQSSDMQFAGYFGTSVPERCDQLGYYPTPQYCCIDEKACKQRQEDANKEWTQALGREA